MRAGAPFLPFAHSVDNHLTVGVEGGVRHGVRDSKSEGGELAGSNSLVNVMVCGVIGGDQSSCVIDGDSRDPNASPPRLGGGDA